MKKLATVLLSCMMALCLLAAPFCVSAEEAAAFDLMPTADDGYTIVEGDGTVSIADGVMTLTNNGDGDLRVLINNTTSFDLTALNTLHMQFKADMPFKMAYHIISNADSSSDWLTTSTEFLDIFELDAAADRTPAGDYDAKMDLNAAALDIADRSAVYFEQFIILVTGKGSFTLNTVEMIATASDTPVSDDPVSDAPADEEPETGESSTEASATTTKATLSKDDSSSFPVWLPIVIVAVAAVACVAVIVIIKRK